MLVIENRENYDKASEILNNLEKLVPNMLQVAYRRINLERRCNNMDKVCSLYEHYISNTKNKVISNNMAIKYARFCWKVKGDVEKAISILNKAVEKDKLESRPHTGNDHHFIEETCGVNSQQKSSVQKAHDEFQRYLKQAKDRKKKSPDLDAKKYVDFLFIEMFVGGQILPERCLDGTSKKAKSLSAAGDSTQLHSSHTQSHTTAQATHSTSQQPPQPPSGTQPPAATTGTGQYAPPNYGQTGGYSQQPPAQGGYQGGQYPPTGPQQPPTPYNQPPYNQQYGQSSDPNYANYQNWGYSQTGYGGYNQGWGNYNYY
ncbi:hypothetical protein ANN_01848 [Periplaneta americana]|uniref:Uncharacterized protein n=1 Tax=Periplaneta americana TaxID=6978 RepID=A0ABQ8TY30_PERAM|nr:hypothetical protein ANN_01848 [Periplaneta americana]